MENLDLIELHFEITNPKDHEKRYQVIRVNLNESIRLSKYILKKILVKKNSFENYPRLDKFTK